MKVSIVARIAAALERANVYGALSGSHATNDHAPLAHVPLAPVPISDASIVRALLGAFWRIAIVAIAFAGAQRLAIELATAGPFTTICFSLAIALVAMFRFGYTCAGGVLVGGAWFLMSMGVTPWLASFGAAAQALALLASVAFLARRGFDPRLRRARDLGLLVVIGVFGAVTLVVSIQVAAFAAQGLIPSDEIGMRWLAHWAAGAQGVLLGAPLLLCWLAAPRPDRRAVEAILAGSIAGALLLFAPIVLHQAIAPSVVRDVAFFALFPFALWAAHYFEPREAALVNIIIAFAACVDLALNGGNASNAFPLAALSVFHGFAACFALATLTFSIVSLERRSGAAALATSEERFRKLTEMGNDWYWEQDAQLRFTLASPGAARVGVDQSALLGKTFWELPFELTTEQWAAHRRTVAAHLPYRELLLTRRLANGEVRHFVTSGEPVFDRDRGFTGYRGVVREISAEKWVEEALRESEQRYASVILNSSAAILTVRLDEQGLYRVESCNHSAESMFELAASKLVGNTPEACLQPRVASAFVARIGRCIVTGARVTEEHAIATRAGEKFVVETLVPILRDGAPAERVIVIAIDVTEQRRVEQRARETEQLFTRVFQTSPTPMVFSRLTDGRITEVNTAWATLFDVPRERAVGRTVHELGIAADDLPFQTAFGEMLRAGTMRYQELRVQRASGVPLDILHSGELLQIGGETIVVSSIVDVTERKRNEMELRRSKDSFSKVFHSSPVPMVVIEYPERHYVEVNDAWLAFFGFTRQEAIGRTAVDLRIWPKPALRDDTWAAFVDGEPVRDVERQLCKKSGELVDVLVSAELIELAGEARVISSIIDITERKQAERRLKASEARFRDFADAAGEYVWEVDADSRFTFVSNRVEAVLGYQPSEIVGRTLCDFTPPGEGVRIRALIEAAQQADGSFRNIEHRMLTKSGSTIWQLVNAVPVHGAEGVVVGYRGTALDVTERKLTEQRVEELATRDPLTGLPNRRLFEDQLVRGTAHAQRTGQLLALMFIDLDRFKTVNDTLGHQVGDGLLKEVARRLSAAIRKGDTLSRFGGDEFVILLEGLKSPGDAGTVAQKIVAEIGAPCEIEGHSITTTCSIGLAVFPSDATDISTLMRYADAAMYAAKAAGRDTYRFFSAGMHARTDHPTKFGSEIRVALDRDEFRLYCQPRLSIADGRITAVQTSMRWRHPQRGVLPPERFIKVAEEAGLARPLGEWLLEHALDQAVQWRDLPDLSVPVAINLHGMQLSASLVESVREGLERHRLDGAMLQLELTESVLLRSIEDARIHLARLRSMGVRVLVDEFGTGYASASYLRRLPVDGVKIAATFVREIVKSTGDRDIARALVDPARAQGIAVIAEGVESAEQLEAVGALGCSEYFGEQYLAPMPPIEFEQRMLRSSNISRLPARRVTRG